MKKTIISIILSALIIILSSTILADGSSNVKVTKTTAYSPKNPAIILSSDRRIHSVWEDINSSSSKWEVYYSSSDSGEVWSSRKMISDDESADSTLPAISTYNDNIYVVWQDKSYNSHNEIYIKVSTDKGVTFSNKVAVSTLDNSISAKPDIAVNSSGTICVTWEDSKEGHQEIYYATSTDNGLTFTESIFSHLDSNNSNAPRITSTTDGIFHIVWIDGKEIYYNNTLNPNSSIAEIDLSNNGYASINPVITATGSDLHVVWQDYSDFNWNIYYKKKDINGWSSTVKKLISNPGESQYPGITSDSDKNLHVVWQDKYDGNEEIYYEKHIYGNSDDKWETLVKLTDNDSIDSLHPVAVASEKTGVDNGVHVLWEYNNNIYYTHIPAGGLSDQNPTLADTAPLYPEDGETIVPITSKISIKFNKAMTESTLLTPTTMRVFKGVKSGSTWSYSTEVNGNRSYNSSGNKLIFTPSSSLINSTKYKVVVTQEAIDTEGNRFLGIVWYFLTEDNFSSSGDGDIRIINALSYPNPYRGNGDINFRYTLSKNSVTQIQSIDIRIYNLQGQIVREIDGDVAGTTNETSWDVTDENGYDLPNGLYIYKIIAKTINDEKSTKTGKIMIVR